jgi:hypothetical protein
MANAGRDGWRIKGLSTGAYPNRIDPLKTQPDSDGCTSGRSDPARSAELHGAQ